MSFLDEPLCQCLVCPFDSNVTDETAGVEIHNPFLSDRYDYKCCMHAWSRYSVEAFSVVFHLLTFWVVVFFGRFISKGKKLESKFRTEGVKREGVVIGYKIVDCKPIRSAFGDATKTSFSLLIRFQNYRGEMVVKEEKHCSEIVTIVKGRRGQRKWANTKSCDAASAATIVKAVEISSGLWDTVEQAYDHNGDVVCQSTSPTTKKTRFLFENQDGKLRKSAAIGRKCQLYHLPQYPNSAYGIDFDGEEEEREGEEEVKEKRWSWFVLFLLGFAAVFPYFASIVMMSLQSYSDIQFGLRRIGILLGCSLPVVFGFAWKCASEAYAVIADKELNELYQEDETPEEEAIRPTYALEEFELPKAVENSNNTIIVDDPISQNNDSPLLSLEYRYA